MVYRRPPSRFGVNSLSMKLSLLISAICLIAGICAAALMLKSEEKQLVFEEHELLKHSSERLSRQFNRLIKTKINIAEQANNVVSSQLLHNESHLPLSDLENMLPWEREIYVDMLITYIKEENEKAKRKQQQGK